MNKLYYHFYIPDIPSHWELLLYEQLDCIEGSGLQHHCEVEICVSSNQENYKKLKENIKSYSFFKSSWFDTSIEDNKNHLEGTTLLKLYDECSSYDNVGYIHSKGITSLSKSSNRWRKVLEYGVIEKWKDNIDALSKGYDVSGIFWKKSNFYFSGNFWWSKSSYIKTLPRPVLSDWKKNLLDEFLEDWNVHEKEKQNFYKSRYRYEGWIGINKPKVNEVFITNNFPIGRYFYQYALDIKRKTILNFANEKTFNYS